MIPRAEGTPLCKRQRAKGATGVFKSESPTQTYCFTKEIAAKWAVLFVKKVAASDLTLAAIWWAFRDSNPGPTGYEPVALTN